ncbi:MAG: pectinesterase family protein [Saprospiraceae bacterium]
MPKSKILSVLLFLFGSCLSISLIAQSPGIVKFPANHKTKVNPDSRLSLTFQSAPLLHNTGEIRIYDASNDELVDKLDLSIPPGPRNTRTPSPYDSFVYASVPDKVYTVSDPDTNATHEYQLNYIYSNSEVDSYHFYPVLINGHTATIHLHNNKLRYNKTYYVQIDPGVFTVDGAPFNGFKGKKAWRFSTKKSPPQISSPWLIVSADGTGDFNTVQGALDFIPDKNMDRKTIFVKNGWYEEIVYFRNKENITLLGEDREETIICYANNGVFNNRPISPDPKLPQKYHNRRAVMAMNHARGIQLLNFTLRSLGEKPAQAEALLVEGDEIVVSHVNIEGSGDALQASGKIYIEDSKIQGFGDNVLGYGAVYFQHCDFVSTYGPHMWIRNPKENHGNVCVNCTFRTIGDVETTIARTNDNKGAGFPYCEAVLLNCSMEGIKPEGWSVKGKGITNIHYWEYNSRNLEDGTAVDVSERDPISRQLSMEHDSVLIHNYLNPAFVLDGWEPDVLPFILKQPSPVSAPKGEQVRFAVAFSSEDVRYQWFRNGKPLAGENSSELILDKVKKRNAGTYVVQVQGEFGFVVSDKVVLKIKR